MNLQDLVNRSSVVKNETAAGANSANRVGSLFELIALGLVSELPAENGISNSDIGKLVQLSTSYKAEVYNEQAGTEGTKGVWKLEFVGVQPVNSWFEYTNNGVYGTGQIFKEDSWGDGTYGSITSISEEVIAFAAYINANSGTLRLKATIANTSTVLIEELDFRTFGGNSTFNYQYEDAELAVEVAAVTPTAPIANKIPIGKLMLVNDGKAYISNMRIETFTASATIESGDTICGSNAGRVRKKFHMNDQQFGTAINNASANNLVRVLMY